MTHLQLLLKAARSQLGVTESPPNTNSGPRVRVYQACTTLGGTHWPWCAAFVAWCFKTAGIPLPYPSASTVELRRWFYAHGWVIVGEPRPGAIVEFDWPGGDVVDHIGIVEVWPVPGHPGYVQTIEGNTSPEGASGSQANGGGVYRRLRPLSVCKTFAWHPGLNAPRVPAGQTARTHKAIAKAKALPIARRRFWRGKAVPE